MLTSCLFGRGVFRRHITGPRQQNALARTRLFRCCFTRKPSGSSQTEIADFGCAIGGHQYVSWLYILMDQTLFMGVMKTPGKLDGNIQDAPEYSLFASFVELPTPNPIRKTTSLHKLRKNARDTSQPTNIVATDDIWMKP